MSDGGTDALGACNVYHRPAAPGGAFDMATGQARQPAELLLRVHRFARSAVGRTRSTALWPAKNRKTTITPRGTAPPAGQTGLPDYVGVYIRAEHDYVTGVLGDTLTITDGSINLLEPQGYSVTG